MSAEERFVTGFGGRRVGKSDGLAPWLTGIHTEFRADQKKWGAVWTPSGNFLYTAPQRSPNCVALYEKLKEALHGLTRDRSDVDLRLELFNRSVITCKSTERPDNLRGPGYDGVASDEIGTTPEEAVKVLYPMLSDPPVHCIRRWLRVGSPRGKKHWSYREYLAGQQGDRGPWGHVSFAYPTWSRPGPEIAAEVERAKRSLPYNVFRQEYGAEFLDDAAGYFQKVAEAHDGLAPPAGPEPGAKYAAGVDLAHTEDWTVVVVVQARPRPMRVVAVERWARTPFPLTAERIAATLKKWDADALFDATSGGFPGEVGVEAFRPYWRRIDGFDSRHQGGIGREDILANLAVGIEQGQMRLPGSAREPAFPILTSELEGVQYELLPHGRARAAAGPGLNDDTVIGLALAMWRAKNLGGGYASRAVF